MTNDRTPSLYWMLAADRLHGPFTPDELITRDDFSAETPLCPDAALGMPDEEWKLAPAFPDFQEVFPISSREPGLLADPTDGAIGCIESRIHLIDRNLGAARKRLESRIDRFQRLRTDIRHGLKAAGEVAKRIQDVGSRAGHKSSIKIEVARAKAALAMQAKRIDSLKEELAAARDEADAAPGLRERISELESAMDALKTAASDAPKHRERITRLEAELGELKRGAEDAPRLKKRVQELEEELFRSSLSEDAGAHSSGRRPRRRGASRRRRTKEGRPARAKGTAGLPDPDFGEIPPL